MNKIIVTGHGKFATGLLSSLELIYGKSENIIPVDFKIDDTTEHLENKLRSIVDSNNGDILMLCDLLGGTPFKVCALLSHEFNNRNIHVLGGVNLPMLIETVLSKDNLSLDELKVIALDSGRKGISEFKLKADKNFVKHDGI